MHNVSTRNFATTAEAARAQEEAAAQALDLTPAQELLLAHGIGEYPSKANVGDDRRFSQAPPTAETVEALLGSIHLVEALGTVLDLSFLVDDVSEDEAEARNLIAQTVASVARIIKSNLED